MKDLIANIAEGRVLAGRVVGATVVNQRDLGQIERGQPQPIAILDLQTIA